jgi:hypothetical protein
MIGNLNYNYKVVGNAIIRYTIKQRQNDSGIQSNEMTKKEQQHGMHKIV